MLRFTEHPGALLLSLIWNFETTSNHKLSAKFTEK
jgi:hypothetical protein